MQRFTAGHGVRTETMQDVGNGPSPFGTTQEDAVTEVQLVMLTARPIPRPPRPTRQSHQLAR